MILQKKLIEEGANVDALYKGITPLQMAILKRKNKIAKVLIEAGANKEVPINLLRKIKHPFLIKTLFPHATLYGCRLDSILLNIDAFKSVNSKKKLLNVSNLVQYLKDENYCLPVVAEALSVLRFLHKVKKYEKSKLIDSESAMDDSKVAMSNWHFTETIQPYFQETLLSFSKSRSKEQAIKNVMFKIRELILDEIKSRANEKNDARILNFIEKNGKKLVAANNSAMKESCKYFNSPTENAHGAWRCFNRFAPVKGVYDNLFTPPKHKNKRVWTTQIDSQKGSRSAVKAYKSIQERLAYYYLSAIDPKDGDETTRKSRITNFIRLLSEIRNEKGVDKPSCYPGTITRIADMGAFHSIAQLPVTNKELIADYLKIKILELFKTQFAELSTPQDKEKLYLALTELTEGSARKIIANPARYSEDLLAIRQNFIALLDLPEINLVEVLDFSDSFPFVDEDICYVDYYLTDCVQGDVATAIEALYIQLTDREPTPSELENANPFNPGAEPDFHEQCDIILKIVLEASPAISKSLYKLKNLSQFLKSKIPQISNGLSLNEALTGLDILEDGNDLILDEIAAALKKPSSMNTIINPFDRQKDVLQGQIQKQFLPAFRLALESRLRSITEKQKLFNDYINPVTEVFKETDADPDCLRRVTEAIVNQIDTVSLQLDSDGFIEQLEEQDRVFIDTHAELFKSLLLKISGARSRVYSIC